MDNETYWLHREAALRRVLAKVLHENYVRTECLEIATEALGHATICHESNAALAEINRRLAELEPEEKTK